MTTLVVVGIGFMYSLVVTRVGVGYAHPTILQNAHIIRRFQLIAVDTSTRGIPIYISQHIHIHQPGAFPCDIYTSTRGIPIYISNITTYTYTSTRGIPVHVVILLL